MSALMFPFGFRADIGLAGDPGRIRTSDLQLRRLGGSLVISIRVDTFDDQKTVLNTPIVDTPNYTSDVGFRG